MPLTAFATATGPAFVDLENVDSISAPFKWDRHDSRVITTRGGAKVYILNSEANRQKLAHLFPADTPKVLAQTPGLTMTPGKLIQKPDRTADLKAAKARKDAKP